MESVKKQLAIMSVIFKRELTTDIVNFYLESLDRREEGEVLRALKRCALELPRFPTVADIYDRMPKEVAGVNEIVGLIFEAVELYGYPGPDRARKHMGEIAWKTVNCIGGWQRLCDTPANQETTLRAQLRVAADECLSGHNDDPERFTPRLSAGHYRDKKPLQSLSDGFQQFLPKEMQGLDK